MRFLSRRNSTMTTLPFLTAMGVALLFSATPVLPAQAQVIVNNNVIDALGPTPATGFGVTRPGGLPAPYPAVPYGAYGGYGVPYGGAPAYGGVPPYGAGVQYYPNRFGGTPYAITGGTAFTPYGAAPYGYGGAAYAGAPGAYGGYYPTQPPRSSLAVPYGYGGGYGLGFGSVPQPSAAEPRITIRPPKTGGTPQPTQVSAAQPTSSGTTAPTVAVTPPPAPEPLTSTTERDSATAPASPPTASTQPRTPAAGTNATTAQGGGNSATSGSTRPTATADSPSANGTAPSVRPAPVTPVAPASPTTPSANGTNTTPQPTRYSTGPLLADPEEDPAGQDPAAEDPTTTQTAALPVSPESQGGARLLFAAGNADLSDAAKTDLDRMIQKLKAEPQTRVQILAYSDGSPDSADRARRQSLDRALAVRNYLFKNGVAVTRMDVRALGFNAEQGGSAPLDRVDILPQTAEN